MSVSPPHDLELCVSLRKKGELASEWVRMTNTLDRRFGGGGGGGGNITRVGFTIFSKTLGCFGDVN